MREKLSSWRYIGCHFFLLLILFGAKKKWFINQIDTVSLSYRQIGCFFCINKEEKEVLEFILPLGFPLLPQCFFIDIEATKDAIEFFKEKKLPSNYFKVFHDFLDYLKNDGVNYDFYWQITGNTFHLIFVNNETRELIKECYCKKDDEGQIKEMLDDFKHQSIKMSAQALSNLRKDLEGRFLNGYDIALEHYNMEIDSISEHNCNVKFVHKTTSRQILVRSVRYDEKTGRVSFAGQSDNKLVL